MIGLLGIRRHARLRERLSAYIDGQVNASEATQVEDHLGGCEECRLELHTLRATVGLLRGLPELAVPRSFALKEAPTAAAATPRVVWTARLATSAAAVLLVALFVGDAAGLLSQRAARRAPAVPEPAAAVVRTAEVEEAAPAAAAPALRSVVGEREVAAPTPAPAPAPALAAPAPAPALAAPAPAPAPAPPAAPAPAPAIAPAAAVPGMAPPEEDVAERRGAVPEETAEERPAAAPVPAPVAAAAVPEAMSEPPAEALSPAPEVAPPPAALPEAVSTRPAPASEEVALPREEKAAGPLDEDGQGLSLPLWQLEVAVGVLLALLASATYWVARATRRR